MALFLPQRWRQQPQYPVRIATEWAPNAVFALNGAVPVESVNRFSYSASPWTQTFNAHGRALENVGNSAILTTNSDLVLPVGSACTILLQGYKTAESAAAPALATATFPGDGYNANIYLPYSGDGNVYWRWGPGEVAGTGSLAVGGLSFDPRDLWAFTTGPRGMEVWQNGAIVGSNSGTPSRSSGGIVVSLGIGNGVGYAQIRLSMLATFNQQMPTAFLRQRQYWGIFQPQRTPRYFILAASGTTYNSSVSESATATDSANAALVAVGAVSETGSVSDTAAASWTGTGAVSETGSASDSTAGAGSFPGAVSDSASASDAVASAATFPSAISETVSASDAEADTAVLPSSISESASASDVVDGSIGTTTYNVSISESVTATDSAAGAAVFPSSVAEVAALVDAFASAAVFSRAITETGAVSDAYSQSGAFIATERIYTITAENRRMNVAAEDRTHTPNAESRTLIA
jgi:hypothetical protein